MALEMFKEVRTNERANKEDPKRSSPRITSYNVCYTKLLRKFCTTESLNYNIIKKNKAIDNADYQLKFNINRYDTDMIV